MSLVLSFAAGCALNTQGHKAVNDLLAEYDREQAAEATRYAHLPRPVPTSRPAVQTLSEQPTLAKLIAAALERNPDIRAAIETARSKASRIPQATALPDPFLSTKTMPEPIRTAEGDNFFIFGIRQTLPVPEKLDRRGRIALEETRMAIEEVEQTRLRVIADVKRAYFQLYAIDKTIGITEENKALLRDLIQVALGEFRVGRRPQTDVLRAQVERSNLDSELVELRQRRITVVALLNSLLDRPYSTSVSTPPDYDARRTTAQLDRVLEQAIRINPELRRIERQIARDEESVRLARLAYWPDFTLGVEWIQMDPRGAFKPRINPQTGVRPRANEMSEDGSDNWALTFGFNLPVWFEKIEAGIREAREKLSASRRKHTSVKNTILFKVRDALARVQSFRDIADLYATSIIPQAQQAYQVSRAGYIAGTSDFQYVIDNWQKWLFFRIAYYRTLGELERSVADLEQTVGISIVEMESAGTRRRVERTRKRNGREGGSR